MAVVSKMRIEIGAAELTFSELFILDSPQVEPQGNMTKANLAIRFSPVKD